MAGKRSANAVDPEAAYLINPNNPETDDIASISAIVYKALCSRHPSTLSQNTYPSQRNPMSLVVSHLTGSPVPEAYLYYRRHSVPQSSR
jgi:hypothetical protein